MSAGAGTADARVQAALSDLSSQGFHVLRDAADPAQIADAREQLRSLLSAAPFGTNSFVGTRTKRIHSIFARTRSVDTLATNALVLDVVAERLGDALLSASVACEIHPGETAQTPHTDDGVYPLPPDFRDVSLSALWAIDDFHPDNGATVVYPASMGNRDVPPTGRGDRVEMAAGSALVYTGTLWHAGGANTTDAPRLGLILTYVESWLRSQDAHLISVPVDAARQLSSDLRGLLGYAMRPPFMGYVHGADPRELFTERPDVNLSET